MVGPKIYILHYSSRNYLTKIPRICKRGDDGSPQHRKGLPSKVCEFLAVANFEHCKGATYMLWSLSSP